MNEFLNPKSMATPGAAGALIMLVTNALCYNFPEFSIRYVGLALSFVIGTVVFSASAMKMWERSIFWVFNSLIIFSVGFGTANFAKNIAAKQTPTAQVIIEHARSVALDVMSIIVGSAFAEGVQGIQAPSTSGSKQSVLSSHVKLQDAKIRSLEIQLKELKAANQSLLQKDLVRPKLNAVAPEKKLEKTFFKDWGAGG